MTLRYGILTIRTSSSREVLALLGKMECLAQRNKIIPLEYYEIGAI